MSKPQRRKAGKRFAGIPLDVLHHEAVTTLDHAAFRILVLLAGEYNGRNNGALGVSWAQAKAHGIGSKNTLYRALKALVGRGLIEQTYPASRVPPRPAMYALDWQGIDDTEYSRATKARRAFTSWSAPKINFRGAMSEPNVANDCAHGSGEMPHGLTDCAYGPDFARSMGAMSDPLLDLAIGGEVT